MQMNEREEIDNFPGDGHGVASSILPRALNTDGFNGLELNPDMNADL
jgi:hypothetical protein